jgi:polyisoprenoid-binding protein YceI
VSPRIQALGLTLLPLLAGMASYRATTKPRMLRFAVAATGNEARYRVREQLMGHDLPNDAVGKTPGVIGTIAIASNDTLFDTLASKLTIDVQKLQSDQARRDGYVQRRLLQTDQYPTVVLVPTVIHGLPSPPPTSGSATFHVRGNLTVKGVTHPTDWTVTATFDKGELTGSASTAFTFGDFDLTQPRVPVLLSVSDTIRLEYDFHLVKSQ